MEAALASNGSLTERFKAPLGFPRRRALRHVTSEQDRLGARPGSLSAGQDLFLPRRGRDRIHNPSASAQNPSAPAGLSESAKLLSVEKTEIRVGPVL